MDPIIIGFGYKRRRGKDSAVQAILESRQRTCGVVRYSFALPLKQEVNQAYERLGSWLAVFDYCYDKLGMPMTFAREEQPDMSDPESPYGKQRRLLQWWGTEYRRAQDPRHWIKYMDQRLAEERPEVVLISDLRFRNEAVWIIQNHGMVVKVDRPDYDGPESHAHTSEYELDGFEFDAEISALSGQMEWLGRQALLVFDAFLLGRTVEYKPTVSVEVDVPVLEPLEALV